MKRRKLMELIIDPSSGDLSMSRLCLGLLIVVYLPALVALEAAGWKLGIWAHIAVIVGSVCSVYGLNSSLRVWRGHVIDKTDKPRGAGE
jgi:hypothetical protein